MMLRDTTVPLLDNGVAMAYHVQGKQNAVHGFPASPDVLRAAPPWGGARLVPRCGGDTVSWVLWERFRNIFS